MTDWLPEHAVNAEDMVEYTIKNDQGDVELLFLELLQTLLNMDLEFVCAN